MDEAQTPKTSTPTNAPFVKLNPFATTFQLINMWLKKLPSTVNFGTLPPETIEKLIETRLNDIFIIDVRGKADAEDRQGSLHNKFKNAYRFPMENAFKEWERFYTETKHAEARKRFKEAKYVIIHCYACENRSPACIAKIMEFLMSENLTNEKAAFFNDIKTKFYPTGQNSKLVLMQPGFKFYEERGIGNMKNFVKL